MYTLCSHESTWQLDPYKWYTQKNLALKGSNNNSKTKTQLEQCFEHGK